MRISALWVLSLTLTPMAFQTSNEEKILASADHEAGGVKVELLDDEVKQIKFEVSRDTDRRPVASRNGQPNQYINIRPKQAIEVWAKYVVPDSVQTVTVSIDGTRPFEKVAISGK